MKEKFIKNGIEYVKCGDYYIPNLTAPIEHYQIGSFGKGTKSISNSITKHFIPHYL